MLNSTIIVSQHWYYSEEFLSKLVKNDKKRSFFKEKKTRSFARKT